MNILYLLFSFTTGGTERLVCDICNEMTCRDHQVHLYVVNDLYDQNMLDGLNPQVNVYLQKRTVGSGSKINTLFRIARYIQKHKIQVVHCNSLDAPELLLLHPFVFPKTTILHTVHDVGQYQTLPHWKRKLRNLLCDHFIAISNCVKEDIIAHGATPKKVSTIYNAIDLTRFIPQPHTNNHLRVGNVARIMPEKKGQDVLLEAVGLLRDQYPHLECLFAGKADASHQQDLVKLQETAVSMKLNDQVHFLGNVEDIPNLLSTLDIFVLPSRYEGFGISLLEAMAMGIPCIASNLDGPAEILQDGKYGLLFETGNAQDLAEKLNIMLTNYPHYLSVAQQTIPHIQESFNIQKMCDRLESVMQKG